MGPTNTQILARSEYVLKNQYLVRNSGNPNNTVFIKTFGIQKILIFYLVTLVCLGTKNIGF